MKRLCRIFVSVIVLAATVLFTASAVLAAENVSIFVNGVEIQDEIVPVIIDGWTMVPVRTVTEAMGCSVEWIGEYQQVLVYMPDGSPLMSMRIDEPVATVHSIDENGKHTGVVRATVESPPVIINGKTFVPLRFISEAMGYSINWVESTRSIYLEGEPVYKFKGFWRITLEKADYGPELMGYLYLGTGGNAAFDYGDGYGPAGMGMVTYRGSWSAEPVEGAVTSVYSLTIDLALDSWFFSKEDEIRSRISGTYLLEAEDDVLTLVRVDGDHLYDRLEYKIFGNYTFEYKEPEDMPSSQWRGSDSELIGYLSDVVEEAADYLAKGKIGLVDGGYTLLPNGDVGRDIHVGVNYKGSFVSEILYTVGRSWDIYKYDKASDSWEIMME